MSGWKRLFIVISSIWLVGGIGISIYYYSSEIMGKYISDACWKNATKTELALKNKKTFKKDGGIDWAFEFINREHWNELETAYIVKCDKNVTDKSREYYWFSDYRGEIVLRKLEDYQEDQRIFYLYTLLALSLPPAMILFLFISVRWIIRGFKE